MRPAPALLAAALVAALPLSSPAAEPPAAVADCIGCHGIQGVSSNPNVPVIAGHSAISLEDNLLAFADGLRPCLPMERPDGEGGTTSMCEVAAALDEATMRAAAEYFAAFAFRPPQQATVAEFVDRGKALHDELCFRCHRDNGAVPKDDAALLAGQWLPYLDRSLRDFAAGRRDGPENMMSKFEDLGEADLTALAHFYASQAPTQETGLNR